MEIMYSLEASPIPNHRMASGIQAIGGMGFSTWIITSVRRSITLDQPTAIPSTTASTAAIRNPVITRCRLASTWVSKAPFSISFSARSAVLTGEVRVTGLM
ncbi:hypothetical protein D3C75_602270 [compost metagenome]